MEVGGEIRENLVGAQPLGERPDLRVCNQLLFEKKARQEDLVLVILQH